MVHVSQDEPNVNMPSKPPPYVIMLGDGDVDVYVSVDVRMCGCVGVWMCR